jgi:hypothetical protein
MNKLIRIRSVKFRILPGEEEELLNEGMYGKSLAQYLQKTLIERGYNTPFICSEDWGWWVELKTAPFAFGVCIYFLLEDDSALEFVCIDGSTGPKKWSWKRFGFCDTSPWVKKLHEDLINIFQSDEDVLIVSVTDEFP